MILVMFGRGVTNVAHAFGAPLSEWITRGAVVAGIVVAYIVVIRGVHVLNIFNSIVTPGLLLATGLLFYVIFRDAGWHGIAARPPLEPVGDSRLGYVIALEFGLGAGFSWWPGIGFLTRNTDTQRNSLYPQVLTMGLGMGIVCCTGLLAGLLFRAFDPTEWMMKAGGPVFGVAALVLVAIANISASAMMMYTASLALRHVRLLRTLEWRVLAALSFVPVISYAIFPELYDQGSAFLAYNATMFAPISGVLLVDYFVLRRRRLNVSQLFEDHPSGHYRFFGGFNVPALFCMVLGQLLYIWLLDPVSLRAHGPVRLVTASAPAVLGPMVLYWLLARLLVIPSGRGAYGASEAPIAIRKPNI
jgi:NCS1 family nucleobase:cation symporter-1